jgi:hypothetical protein
MIHTHRTREQERRSNESGATLISVLVAALLVGFIELEMLGLLSLNSAQGSFLWARMDTLNSVNYSLNAMGQRVRSARNIGDLYGEAPPPQGQVVQNLPPGPQQHPEAVDPSQMPNASIQNGSVTLVSNHFPSAGDILYGPQGSMTVTSWPWDGGQGNPYTLSSTCLVIQVPNFDSNGFPMSLPPAFSGAVPLSALDTYVYKVVPDPNPAHAGEYQLQMAYFPSPAALTNAPTGIGPGTLTTVLTGIVGPKDASGDICVFQYVEKNLNTVTTTVNAANLQNYSGVVVNLQVVNMDARGHKSLLPVRTEMYMRNNVAATTIGSPPPT